MTGLINAVPTDKPEEYRNVFVFLERHHFSDYWVAFMGLICNIGKSPHEYLDLLPGQRNVHRAWS